MSGRAKTRKVRANSSNNNGASIISVCLGTGGIAAGGDKVFAVFEREIKKKKLTSTRFSCFGPSPLASIRQRRLLSPHLVTPTFGCISMPPRSQIWTFYTRRLDRLDASKKSVSSSRNPPSEIRIDVAAFRLLNCSTTAY